MLLLRMLIWDLLARVAIMNWIRYVNCLFTYDVINSDVRFKMFQYNPKADYQPNGG